VVTYQIMCAVNCASRCFIEDVGMPFFPAECPSNFTGDVSDGPVSGFCGTRRATEKKQISWELLHACKATDNRT